MPKAGIGKSAELEQVFSVRSPDGDVTRDRKLRHSRVALLSRPTCVPRICAFVVQPPGAAARPLGLNIATECDPPDRAVIR
jgi:hypothetical protein